MTIVLYGASGRTGGLIARRLIAMGRDVVAAGRSDPGIDGLRFRRIDVMDPGAVQASAAGMEAAISALGSSKGNPVCSALARGLSGQAGLRFVTIAGAAVDAPGDAKAVPDRIIGWIMRRIVAEMLADRQAELAVLGTSPLAWTMLRPPRLTDGPPTGKARLTFDKPAATAITRADLADAVIEALADPALVGRAPFVAG